MAAYSAQIFASISRAYKVRWRGIGNNTQKLVWIGCKRMIWRILSFLLRDGVPALKANACLLLLASAMATAAVEAAEPDKLLTGYSLTSWTHGDGVPLGTV